MGRLDDSPIDKFDLIVGGFILLMVGITYSFAAGPENPGYEPSERCQNWVSAVEANLTRQGANVSCNCEPGDEHRDRLDAPSEVRNVSDLEILSCSVNDRNLIFPVWKVNSSEVMGDNETAVNETRLVE